MTIKHNGGVETGDNNVQKSEILVDDKQFNPEILTEEFLYPKQFNLITKDKSANNIFYYEVYSQPLEDGSYSQMMQIE